MGDIGDLGDMGDIGDIDLGQKLFNKFKNVRSHLYACLKAQSKAKKQTFMHSESHVTFRTMSSLFLRVTRDQYKTKNY